MSEFTVIETQEQLDKVIGERIKRERETVQKQYEGFLSPDAVKKQYEGFLSPEDVEKKYEGFLSPEEVAKKDATIKQYETNSAKMRIALEEGIPYEIAARLSGDDEESIRKDAQALAKLVVRKSTTPLANQEGNRNDKDADLKKMLHDLNGKGE